MSCELTLFFGGGAPDAGLEGHVAQDDVLGPVMLQFGVQYRDSVQRRSCKDLRYALL